MVVATWIGNKGEEDNGLRVVQREKASNLWGMMMLLTRVTCMQQQCQGNECFMIASCILSFSRKPLTSSQLFGSFRMTLRSCTMGMAADMATEDKTEHASRDCLVAIAQ